jgi:hypothetical protein
MVADRWMDRHRQGLVLISSRSIPFPSFVSFPPWFTVGYDCHFPFATNQPGEYRPGLLFLGLDRSDDTEKAVIAGSSPCVGRPTTLAGAAVVGTRAGTCKRLGQEATSTRPSKDDSSPRALSVQIKRKIVLFLGTLLPCWFSYPQMLSF